MAAPLRRSAICPKLIGRDAYLDSIAHVLGQTRQAHGHTLLLASDEQQPQFRHFLAQLDRERLATEIALMPLAPHEVEEMLDTIFQVRRLVCREFLAAPIPLPTRTSRLLRTAIREISVPSTMAQQRHQSTLRVRPHTMRRAQDTSYGLQDR